jgi:ribosomal protein L29
MERLEILETLVEIEEGIEQCENQIAELKWSNEFGIGLELKRINDKNTNDIDAYKRDIARLNKRFNKLVNTLK